MQIHPRVFRPFSIQTKPKHKCSLGSLEGTRESLVEAQGDITMRPWRQSIFTA